MPELPTAVPVFAGEPSAPKVPNGQIIDATPASSTATTNNSPDAAQEDLGLRGEGSRRLFLSSLGLIQGIQDEIIGSLEAFPVRHFILDNSGSMSVCDGHMHITSGTREGFVQCSRWKELLQSVQWLGELAIGLAAPTEFKLINPSAGIDVASLGHGLVDQERAQLAKLISSSPNGKTPLCQAIRQVVTSISRQAPELRRNGQRAMVEIATDGASTDGDLASALKPLEQLPVWVVVRLCTDEEDVVEYWNSIDEQLELELDVLDDLEGEAEEVKAVNPWLVYGEQLHRLREWGSPNKLLDLLDEAAFSPAQAAEFVELVLGRGAAGDLPPPSLDLDGFMQGVDQLQSAVATGPAGLVFDPLTKSRSRWFKTRLLRAAARSKDGGIRCGGGSDGGIRCAIM